MTKRKFTDEEREAIKILERFYEMFYTEALFDKTKSIEESIENFAEKEMEMIVKKAVDEAFNKIVNESSEDINWVKCKKESKK